MKDTTALHSHLHLLTGSEDSALSQRILFFTSTGYIRIFRLAFIALAAVGIIRIGHCHPGDAHLVQHRTEGLSRKEENTLTHNIACRHPFLRIGAFSHKKKGGKARNLLNGQSFRPLFLPT